MRADGAIRWVIGAVALLGCAVTPEDDDDWIDNDEEAIAVAGRWIPTVAATAAGNRQFVRYDGAGAWNGGRNCGGSLLAGTRELGDYLRRNFTGVSSYGGYACRANTAATSQMSVHGTGRAIDVFIPLSGGQADNTRGDEVANWLISNAQSIGVQLVIWDRSGWNASRGSKLSPYGGPHPHHDHLHVELNTDAAARRTPWFRGGSTAPPAMTPTTPPSTMPTTPGSMTPGSMTPGSMTPEAPPPAPPGGVASRMRVFVSALNLRRGPGTSNEIITAMPCGSALIVVAGPSNGWFQVNYNGTIGWSSGNFLLPESSFQRSVCGG